MLKFLRKKGVMKKILWVVAVLIIISFGFFGTANYLNRRRRNFAGIIFGQRVSFDKFREALFYARNQAIMTYGQNFFKIQQFLDLQKEAWDRLILLYEARKRKIRVSDDEVRQAILNMPLFQTNGQFNPQRYKQLVEFVFRTKPRPFEEGIRQALMLSKLFEQQTAFVTLSDEEILDAYKKIHQKVEVEYILFSPKPFEDKVTVSDEDIKKYYGANKDSFRQPPSIKVQYVFFPFHKGATTKQKDTVTTQASKMILALENNPDFKKAAETLNQTVHESRYFSREYPDMTLGWPFEVMDKAFGLKKGEISPAIQTEKGIYIVKVIDKKDSYIPSFEEAKPQVKKILRRIKANQLAKAKAEEVLTQIRQKLQENPNLGFSQVASQMGLTVKQTEPFKRGDYIAGIGISRDFQEAAFALSAKQRISDVVPTPAGYCILHLKAFKEIDKKQFAKDKKAFAKKLLAQKKQQAFMEFLARLRAKANVQSNVPSQKGPSQGQ